VSIVVKKDASEARHSLDYPGGRTALKLDHKEPAAFYLQTNESLFMEVSLLGLQPDNLWIEVESFGGIVARIPGKDIQEAMRKVLAAGPSASYR
jgi:hypothetical protein